MINRLIEISLRNRGLVIVLYLGFALWGYWALTRTPIDAITDLSENQVIVFTDWTGRSPQEVEDQVTYPLVSNLQGLAGVRVVRASSAFGFSFSMINVIFEDNIPLSTIVQAVQRSNNNVGGNVVEQAGQWVVVRGIGLIQSTDDVANIVIGSANGTAIYVFGGNEAACHTGSWWDGFKSVACVDCDARHLFLAA